MKFGSLGIAKILEEGLIRPAQDHPEIKVIAVSSREESIAKDYAQVHSIKKYYSDYNSLIIDKDVEAVYIPLPNGLHYEWAVKALEAGKHVLCEKPLCSNGFEAFSLFELAKNKNLILLDAYHHSFHPTFIRAKEIIKRGDIGEIKEIKGRFTVNIPRPDIRFDYNLSGGAFMDPGCYLVHALVHFFEDYPEIVSTEVKRDKTDSRIDIKSKAELLIGGKTKAEIYSSIESKKDMEIWIEFLGEEGSLKIDNYVRSEWGKLCLRGKDNITKEESFSSKSTFSHQLDKFLTLVQEGPNENLANESKKIMKLLDELYIFSDLPIRGEEIQ